MSNHGLLANSIRIRQIRNNTECQRDEAIVTVQKIELREVAELRWDGAIESIRVEGPEKPTIQH